MHKVKCNIFVVKGKKYFPDHKACTNRLSNYFAYKDWVYGAARRAYVRRAMKCLGQ